MNPDNTATYLLKHILVCAANRAGRRGRGGACGAESRIACAECRQLYRDGECSCLGLCREGVNAVVWPDGRYFSGVTVADVPRLVDFIEGKGPAPADLEARAAEKIAIKKKG